MPEVVQEQGKSSVQCRMQ